MGNELFSTGDTLLAAAKAVSVRSWHVAFSGAEEASGTSSSVPTSPVTLEGKLNLLEP